MPCTASERYSCPAIEPPEQPAYKAEYMSELAAFSQFGSDLDADTKEKLAQGERIREVLKQPQYQPMAVEKQIAIIYAATKKHLLDIAVSDIAEYEKVLFDTIESNYPEVFQTIREQKVLTEEVEPKLILAIEQAKENFISKK